MGAISPALAWVLESPPAILGEKLSGIQLSDRGTSSFTVKKLGCSKQAVAVEYVSME